MSGLLRYALESREGRKLGSYEISAVTWHYDGAVDEKKSNCH